MIVFQSACILSGAASSIGPPLCERDFAIRLAGRLESAASWLPTGKPPAALPDRLRTLFLSCCSDGDDPLLALWRTTRDRAARPPAGTDLLMAARHLHHALPRDALHAVLGLDQAGFERAVAGDSVVAQLEAAALHGLADNHLHSGGATELGELVATLVPRLAMDIEPREPRVLIGSDSFDSELNLLPLLLGLAASALLLYVLRRDPPADRPILDRLARLDDAWWLGVRDLAVSGAGLDPAAFAVHRATLKDASYAIGRTPQVTDVYAALRAANVASPPEVRAALRRGLVSLSCLQTAVSSPLRSSLGSFVARFNLMRALRGCLGPMEDRLERTLMQMYVDGVTSCELRKTVAVRRTHTTVSVERLVASIRSDVREHAQSAATVCQNLDGPEITVRMAVSFLRRHAPADLASRPSTFAAFRQPIGDVLAVSDAIAVFAQRHPTATRFIGAVDVAGDERITPNWLYALAFQRVTDLLAEGAKLEFAAHVGEYYNHQLEGLRHISELALFGPHVRRAGHCLALSPVDAAVEITGAASGVVLEDLIWTVMALKSDSRLDLGPVCDIADPASVIERCTRLMMQLAQRVFGSYVSVNTLTDWFCDRFDLSRVAEHIPMVLDRPDLSQGWPDGLDLGFSKRPTTLRSALLFVTLLAADHELEINGRTIRLQFDADAECPPAIAIAARNEYSQMAAALASHVAARLVRTATVVETCPSSNMSLGPLRMCDHPVFAMTDAGISCSVSTDDPAIFGSSLRDEYLHIGVAAAARRDLPNGLLSDLAQTSRTTGSILDSLTRSGGSAAQSYEDVLSELRM